MTSKYDSGVPSFSGGCGAGDGSEIRIGGRYHPGIRQAACTRFAWHTNPTRSCVTQPTTNRILQVEVPKRNHSVQDSNADLSLYLPK